jgi:predicted amidohydrolase
VNKQNLIALPAAFTMQTGKDHWEVLLRACAIETVRTEDRATKLNVRHR